MPPIRLIAMDMDGTLLTRIDPVTARIPEENAAVLRRCVDAGVHLALASGRMPDDASFYAVDAGLPMHIIGLNGGVILDGPLGKPVYEQLLPESTARRVFAILEESGADVAVFGLWEVASLRPQLLDWAQRELGTWFGRSGGRLHYHTGRDAAMLLLPRAGKIVALTKDDRAGLAAAKARICRECPDVTLSSSWWNNFEVNPAGVDKGSALNRLADGLGIPLSQVMAIGDNDNDVPMLRTAGFGVAMDNANESARAASTHITLPNDESGVAAAIRSLVFGEIIPGVKPLR